MLTSKPQQVFSATLTPPPQKPKLLDQVRAVARARRLAPRVGQTHVDWITRFILFHRKRHPRELGMRHVRVFISHVRSAHPRDNSAHAAATAIRFLYREVLKCEPSAAPRDCRAAAPPKSVTPAPQRPAATPVSSTPGVTTASNSPMSPNTASAAQPKLLDRLAAAIRARHYSIRTEEAYAGCITRFILFHNKRHPLDMGEAEVNQFQ